MRDSHTEAWLKKEGVEYRFIPTVPLAKFCLSKEPTAQIRFERYIEDVLDRYTLSMISGDDFPGLVAWSTQHGLEIIDGYHRIKAAQEAERSVLDCYVVATHDPAVIERLRATANREHGAGLTEPEVRARAVAWVREKRYAATQIDKILNIRPGTVTRWVVEDQVKTELLHAGIAPGSFNITSLKQLHAIPMLQPRLAAARLIRDKKLSTPEIGQLLAEARAQTSEADTLQVIADFGSRPSVKARDAQTQNNRITPLVKSKTQLLAHVAAVANLLVKEPDALKVQLSPEDFDRLREQMHKINEQMEKLLWSNPVPDYRANGVHSARLSKVN